MTTASSNGAARLAAKAATLLAAHKGLTPLVLANIWDVASARIVEEAGFLAIATSSRAIAGVFGMQDDDSSDPDVIFGIVARIANSVACPVTADLEAGYGLVPEELVDRIVAAGVAGCNLEDTDHHGSSELVDAEKQAAWLAEVRESADARGVHIVINARIDTFIRDVGDKQEQLYEAIRRGRLYFRAGADCVFPIGLDDRDDIAEFTAALSGPVNVLRRRDGPSIGELTTLGVKRISVGSQLFQLIGEQLRDAVRQFAVASGRNDSSP